MKGVIFCIFFFADRLDEFWTNCKSLSIPVKCATIMEGMRQLEVLITFAFCVCEMLSREVKDSLHTYL